MTRYILKTLILINLDKIGFIRHGMPLTPPEGYSFSFHLSLIYVLIYCCDWGDGSWSFILRNSIYYVLLSIQPIISLLPWRRRDKRSSEEINYSRIDQALASYLFSNVVHPQAHQREASSSSHHHHSSQQP